MIDTTMFLSRVPPDPRVVDALEEPQESYNMHTGEFIGIKGKHKNMWVTAFQDRLRVSGSIARYHHGSNFYPIYPSEAKEALCTLSDTFHTSFDEANVYRLDFGLNVMLERPVSDVLSSLGYATGYMKDTYAGVATGVRYRAGTTGKSRAINIYDKKAEAKAKRSLIRDEFKDEEVLRFEVQLKSKVKRQLKRAVKGQDLTDPVFHAFMLTRLEEELSKIQIIRPADSAMPLGIKGYKESRCNVGIETLGGVEEELNRLRALKEEGAFADSPSAYYRMRKEIIDLGGSPDITLPNEAGEEFQKAIREAATAYRLHSN